METYESFKHIEINFKKKKSALCIGRVFQGVQDICAQS